MIQNRPIKTDVFSFTTIRPPQLIDEKSKRRKFVFHPGLEASKIYQALLSNQDIKADQRKLINALEPALQGVYKKLTDLRQTNTEIYDFARWLADNKYTLKRDELLEIACNIKTYEKDGIINVWDQLFFELVTRRSKNIRQGLAQVLIADHVISILDDIQDTDEVDDDEVNEIANSWVVIPQEIFDLIEYDGVIKGCTPHGVKNLGLIIYRKVQQQLKCYATGEVSRIESFMAKAYKERHTRNLVSSQITTETQIESEIENISDTISTDRNELQIEIGKIMDRQRSFAIGGGISASYGFGDNNISASLNTNFASANAMSTSNHQAKNYAQEITRQATERIQQKITRKSTSSIIKEFEENIRHGFDNRDGGQNFNGVFHFLDKVYTNELVNYGKRQVFKLFIPCPANFYKFVESFKYNTEETDTPPPPPPEDTEDVVRPLSDFKINSKEDITKDNYSEPAEEYGITIPSPPTRKTSSKVETFSFTVQTEKERKKHHSKDFKVIIPEGYRLYKMFGKIGYKYKSTANPRGYITCLINGVKYEKTNLRGKGSSEIGFNKDFTGIDTRPTGSIPINVSILKLYSFTVNITLYFETTDEAFKNWQTQTYDDLRSAYESKLQEQETSQEEEETQQIEIPVEEESPKPTNPLKNRLIEQQEIKRISIEMLTKCLKFKMGRSFCEEDDSCGDGKLLYHVTQSEEFAKYVEQVEFLETAIDWGIMGYEFLAPFWEDPCKWVDLYKIEVDNDPLFEAFKKSGMAIVYLPVTNGYEEAIIHYLRSGEIYEGQELVIGSEDEFTLSLLTDLHHEEGQVEKSWETRIGTNLTIIQDQSAVLEEGGLPCYQDQLPEDQRLETNIIASTVKLGDNTQDLLGGGE